MGIYWSYQQLIIDKAIWEIASSVSFLQSMTENIYLTISFSSTLMLQYNIDLYHYLKHEFLPCLCFPRAGVPHFLSLGLCRASGVHASLISVFSVVVGLLNLSWTKTQAGTESESETGNANRLVVVLVLAGCLPVFACHALVCFAFPSAFNFFLLGTVVVL